MWQSQRSDRIGSHLCGRSTVQTGGSIQHERQAACRQFQLSCHHSDQMLCSRGWCCSSSVSTGQQSCPSACCRETWQCSLGWKLSLVMLVAAVYCTVLYARGYRPAHLKQRQIFFCLQVIFLKPGSDYTVWDVGHQVCQCVYDRGNKGHVLCNILWNLES